MTSRLRYELFFGTGGVGKTTLAAARAIARAQAGERILLVTIDPARRLKDLMGLREEDAGEVKLVADLPEVGPLRTPLAVILMNPHKTIARMGQLAGVRELAENRIVKVLAKPHGGMNEILALIELQLRIEEQDYDGVILDTPPGTHFLDFLEGIEKIRRFFDQRFVEIFTSLGRRLIDNEHKGIVGRLMDRVVNAGVNKLLGYLEKVTGEHFVEDFLRALEVINRSRSVFTKGLKLEETLASPKLANWYLVTSVEQGKMHEALEIQRLVTRLRQREMFLILNKTLADSLASWPAQGRARALKESIVAKEAEIRADAAGLFAATLEFPEIMEASPLKHLSALAERWGTHDHQD